MPKQSTWFVTKDHLVNRIERATEAHLRGGKTPVFGGEEDGSAGGYVAIETLNVRLLISAGSGAARLGVGCQREEIEIKGPAADLGDFHSGHGPEVARRPVGMNDVVAHA